MRLVAFEEAIIPAELATALTRIGIRTDVELAHSGPTHDVLKRLPAGTTSLKTLAECTAAIAKHSSAPGVPATKILAAADAQELTDDLVGIPELDGLLGGFGGPRVIQFSGDKGSGKTALALNIVLRHLSTHVDRSALWMDTTGEVSVERIRDTFKAHTGHPGAATALDRLQVSVAFDVDAAQDVLDDVLHQSQTVSEHQISYIIVDAITPLISPLLSAISSQGHAIMTGFMRQLHTLACGYNITVIVINNSTMSKPNNPLSSFWLERKPALGPSFSFLCDAILWLSQYNDSLGDTKEYTTHVAEVFASKSTKLKTWCSFRIIGNTIVNDT